MNTQHEFVQLYGQVGYNLLDFMLTHVRLNSYEIAAALRCHPDEIARTLNDFEDDGLAQQDSGLWELTESGRAAQKASRLELDAVCPHCGESGHITVTEEVEFIWRLQGFTADGAPFYHQKPVSRERINEDLNADCEKCGYSFSLSYISENAREGLDQDKLAKALLAYLPKDSTDHEVLQQVQTDLKNVKEITPDGEDREAYQTVLKRLGDAGLLMGFEDPHDDERVLYQATDLGRSVLALIT
jgi:hypothetical protein